ncbi:MULTISPECIES: WXG100 family type VII secretion target [Streptomyces]|uniref:WXG100 family type VII secretion target n=1 Tax=Streptomyces TaxID=1883 RepID=UPI002248F2F4|nr:hypothetical protein [Streptomyces sp. JHD 1]MCX2967584.1 hypothetical protein [Streptomyces sp. JHD 1]
MSEEYTDEEIVAGLSNYIEARRVIQSLPFVPGGPSLGQTDWENRRLNDMVDMIDSARPSDLQAVGDALKDAADAISDIGDEITKYSRDVEWEGRAAEAFKDWALNLGKNTSKLGTYTDYAGTQLQVAAEGLASVKSSMPPRDPDAGPGLPLDEVPAPARVEGNERWTAAQKKEKDRQEAINQMNRLSSYYKVTRDLMASQDEPTFGPMPNIGVPFTPLPPEPAGDGSGTTGRTGSDPRTAFAASEVAGGVPTAASGPSAVDQPYVMSVSPTVPQGTGPVGTDINGVSVAPAAADPAVRAPSPAPNPQTPQTGPSVPSAPPPSTFTPSREPRQSRSTATPNRSPGQGPKRSGGRASTTNPPTPSAPGGSPSPTAGRGQGPVGRPFLPTAPGAGRPEGIVGGVPQRQGPTTGLGAPRAPHGLVVGGEHAPVGRPPLGGSPAAPGTPGNAAGGPAADRRLASERGGVFGNPRPGTQVPARRTTDFTPGGTGLVRGATAAGGTAPLGAANATQPRRERDRPAAQRPDYLSEDEATWTPRRDVVPQVID